MQFPNMRFWHPRKKKVSDTLFDGVPDWLVESLLVWVHDVECSMDIEYSQMSIASNRNRRKEFILRFDRLRRTHSGLLGHESPDVLESHISSDPDFVLDYIDYLVAALAERDKKDREYEAELEARRQKAESSGQFSRTSVSQIGMTMMGDPVKSAGLLLKELDDALIEGGSKWHVGDRGHATGLIERVDPTMDAAADKAMDECGKAGEQLEQAWNQLFGRNPNPSQSYATTIKAMEAASESFLGPADKGNYTLGKGLTSMRNQHWRYAIEALDETGNNPPHNVDGGVIQLMMRSIWENHKDRHADDSGTEPVSAEQARAAIFLAVPVIQAFHDNLVSRPE